GRQPFGGAVGPLGVVGRSVYGAQVGRVVGEDLALGIRPPVRPGRPGVGQRNKVIDLHLGAGLLTADERDRGAGVGVVQRAGQHLAAVAVEPLVDQVADQDLVAGVLAVPVQV